MAVDQGALDWATYHSGEGVRPVGYHGEGGGGGGGTDSSGRSTGSIDMSQVPSVQEYIKGQFASEDPALLDLVKQMQSREKPLDIYGRLETEAGLPELRNTSNTLSKEISSIEDYLRQIEPDISARTRESMVTEAQRRGMVAAGREPFLEKLDTMGTALGRITNRISAAEQGIGTKVNLAMQGQQMDLEPAQLRYATMVDRNARLTTGFTADRQTKLDVMFDKLNRERTLSDQDWQLANQLASEERNYMRTLQTSAANAGITLRGNESTNDILSLIGRTAAEEKAYQRSKSSGSGTVASKKEAAALVALRKDVAQGVKFEDLVRRYGVGDGALPTYQIREEYNNGAPATQWGWGPATEPESTVQQWALTPKAGNTETSTAREKVEGMVINSIMNNTPREDIEAYIRSEGFDPASFGQLQGYVPKPVEEEKKKFLGIF
jgi:hypothetical protein